MDTTAAVKKSVDDSWFFNHPKLRVLELAGICNERVRSDAILVYTNLIEVQRWFDVELVPAAEKNLVFIVGRKLHEALEFEVVLPVPLRSSFNPVQLHSFIGLSKDVVTHSPRNEGLTLALIDGCQSIIFYKLTEGLLPPKPPSADQAAKMAHVPEWNERKRKWK